MVTVSMKSFTGVGEEFICNIREITEYFIWTNSYGFKFDREVNRFNLLVNDIGTERKLFLMSYFKCGKVRG